jgi:type I restriction enzyme S subunit
MSWSEVPFDAIIADSAFGPRFSGDCYADDGNVATLRTTDLSPDGFISLDTMPHARIDEDKFESHFLQVGDLVISRSGRIGTTALFDGYHKPVLPGAFLIRFRLDLSKAHPLFFRLFFNSNEGQQRLLSVAQGAAQQNINITNVRKLSIPLPPLAEQYRIASLLACYDDLIAINQRRIALLEDAARRLYREWFVHLRFPSHESVPVKDGLPEGWQRDALDRALFLQRGFDLPNGNRIPGDVPIYASTGINGFHNEAKSMGPGVVTGRSGTLGQVHYVTKDFWPLNTSLWVKEFRCVSPLVAYFLLQELNLEQFNSGASVPTLDRKTVHQTLVLLPPPEVVEQFDARVQPFFDQIDTLRANIQGTSKARDLLLLRLPLP